MPNVVFHAQFTVGKVGATGKVVTVDVDRIARADGARTPIVTGGAATEGIRGCYRYVLSDADLQTYDYLAIFITTDATVDQKEIPALSPPADPVVDVPGGLTAQGYTPARAARLDDLDAAVSTRSTYGGGPVASVVAPVAVADRAGFKLAPDGLDLVTIEAGINARQALCGILASAAGALGGAGTGTVVIKGAGVATTRVTATTDAAGNRTLVTLSLPA